MSDEISILLLISEENPTSASATTAKAQCFAADNRLPYPVSNQATMSDANTNEARRTAAAAPATWRIARDTGRLLRLIIDNVAHYYFANAKTLFTLLQTTASFSGAGAAYALLNQDHHLTDVNGNNAFNKKFVNSNSNRHPYRLAPCVAPNDERA
ncbi:hypothetical protein QUF31_13170 [Dickeya chrysanthemi]|uniref:hypothetical protein n=1 Tax=Dickeya TaxID=204037 RepID=UPI000532E22B|nr:MULTISPECIES: hypothetical protein [Dickeya]TYL41683.1 hypothetical protein FDP13_16755 [Dickeya sp. ws52]WJM84115.1 hypothetical protein QUF31_13170 [Dickeya chrysanthemi]